MPDPVDCIRALASRLHHAEMAAANGMVQRIGDEIVYTGASGQERRMELKHGEHGLKIGPCIPPCEDSQIRRDVNRGWCKHRLAAILVLRGEGSPSESTMQSSRSSGL
jgi:hypothetical protein